MQYWIKQCHMFEDSLHTEKKRATDSASATGRREMRASELPPSPYVARTGNFIDGGAEYTGALQILKVILSYELFCAEMYV